MKKIAQKLAYSLIAVGAFESASALDSGAQNLTATAGATDYFKINCAGDTDHLNFKLLEDAVTEKPVEPPVEAILPQVLNAKLTKLKLNAAAYTIEAGTNKDLVLKGGNGSYILSLDTLGTDSTLKNSQAYSVQYQCLNTKGKITTSSSSVSGSLGNGKTKKYTIKCNKSKTTGDTSSLKIKVTNQTPVAKIETVSPIVELPTVSSGNLMAQVFKGFTALNTIGAVVNLQGGNGDYSVMVNSPINAAKNYRFQYSCLNTSNVEAKTSPIQTIQDQ